LIDEEMKVFKGEEKYDFVKDIKGAYSNTLQKSRIEQIFETLPDHVFWDIKKPLVEYENPDFNPYNSWRDYPFETFFDSREFEEYRERQDRKRNIRDSVSTYRRY
jgi:hypothetical protein